MLWWLSLAEGGLAGLSSAHTEGRGAAQGKNLLADRARAEINEYPSLGGLP